jgi:GT2 family glycosyltransferase/glycosyltransferase involved in cell wall biosynthesis
MQDTAPETTAFINLIYGKVLQRQPDEVGAKAVESALDKGSSVGDILHSFLASDEARMRKVTTAVIPQIYQSLYLMPDVENLTSLPELYDGLSAYFQKRYLDDDPSLNDYSGSVWIDRTTKKISGWLLFPGVEDQKMKVSLRIPGMDRRSETVEVHGGVALIDIPTQIDIKANNYVVFDPEKHALIVRPNDILRNQVLVASFYATQNPDAGEKPFQHYVETGLAAGALPNPFFVPALLEANGVTVQDLLALNKIEDHSYLRGMIDVEYCANRNEFAPTDVVVEATKRLMRNDWVDFHPMLTKADFARSGEENIVDWLRVLCTAETSLIGHELDRFSPSYYRNSCAILEFENELIDYLFSSTGETGDPHVLFNAWYATQHLPSDFDWPTADIWLDSFVHPGKYNIPMSPFWDPLTFQHKIVTEHNVTPQSDQCALDLFLAQDEILLEPAGSVIASGVMHSFLGRPLEECDNASISGRDIIHALETALNRQSESVDAPELSVCILNYNKPGFSILAAIAAATNTNRNVEVLVLDNGSSPMDFAVIKKYTRNMGNVKVIRSQANLFFGEGNNVLVDIARGEKILFLNNDAFVGPKTIDDMLDHLDKTPSASAVGPTFLFPNLEIQEAGGTISNCGRQVQLNKHTSLEGHKKYMPKDAIEGVQYVSAACVCVRREVLQDIGGFDYMYEPFYFEDTDFCKRMESLGYRLDYLPSSFVIHYENASTREFLSTGFMSQIEKNRMKFQGRWLYRSEGFKPRALISEVKTPASPKRKTAVVYTPFDVSVGGGERYILSCALALSQKYNVVFCSNKMVSDTRISFVIEDLGLETPGKGSIRTDMFENIKDWGDVEVMIAMGNEIIPPIPFNATVNIFHCQYPFPSHHSDRFEVSRLQNVDAFFVNSEFTKRKVQSEQHELSFDIPVTVTGAPVRAPGLREDNVAEKDDSLFSLISVGRFEPLGHSKRQDITIDIFREFYDDHNDADLSLIGSVGGIARREQYVLDLRKMADGLPVSFDLDASNTVLADKLKNADVLVHSCGYGIDVRSSPERLEHFGIVILEAMANGVVPLVYGAGGPAEIVEKFGVGYTFKTVSEAADKLSRIKELSVDERVALAQRAKVAAAHYFDGAFQKSILDSVNKLVAASGK